MCRGQLNCAKNAKLQATFGYERFRANVPRARSKQEKISRHLKISELRAELKRFGKRRSADQRWAERDLADALLLSQTPYEQIRVARRKNCETSELDTEAVAPARIYATFSQLPRKGKPSPTKKWTLLNKNVSETKKEGSAEEGSVDRKEPRRNK